MNYPLNSCQRSIYILPIPIPTHRTRNLLWIIPFNRNMKYRSSPIYPNHSNSLYRICTSMRTNKILRSYSNYQPFLRYPLYRKNFSRMNMRRVRGRQRHPQPILRNPLHPPLRNSSYSNFTLTISPSNRIQ